MNRTTVAVAIFVVVVGAGWGLFIHDPVESPADAPYTGDEPDGPYTASMEIVPNGETFMEYTVVDDHSDGEQFVRREFSDSTWETYWIQNRSFSRAVAQDEEAYQRVTDIGENERILSKDDEALSAVVLTEDAEPPLADQQQPEELAGATLQYPDYERTGTTTYNGEEVVVYRASGGWYDASDLGGTGGVRITDAEGELYVDADTGVLHRANVSYSFVNADTWGEYLIEKHHGDGVNTVTVTYEYEAGEVDADRPEWANSEGR